MWRDMLDHPLIKALLMEFATLLGTSTLQMVVALAEVVAVVELLQVDVAVVQLEVVALVVPEEAAVQPSAMVVEVVLVGTV
jgi:hypothetical protein